jgi:5'-deoxynucleotidase YfbR-like HD superfamily hydrolase
VKYDFVHTVKIILIHDLAEIKTGDMSASNADSKYNAPETKQAKEDAEKKAMKEIFADVEEAFASECL